MTDLQRPLAVLVVGALAIAACWHDDYASRILAVIALAIVASCGLNILAGVTGQISLGHAGFYALGAYTTALLSVRQGWSIWATMPVGLLLTGIVGLLLAWPALRLRGPYLTMVTIAFGAIVYGVATDFPGLTNGPEGLTPVPGFSFGGKVLGLQGTNLLLLCVVALGVYVHAALIEGRPGRAMRAVRGNEIAASSLGIHVVGTKCLAFGISGLFAGVAGMLYAPVNGFVNPDSFTMDLSVLMLLMVILGGRGTVWGPVAGAIVLTLIDRLLSSFGDVRLVIYGVTLLATLYLMPHGLVGLIANLRRRTGNSGDVHPESLAVPAGALPGGQPGVTAGAVLEVLDLSRAFGGLKAVDGVGFQVRPGSIHGLVGPNGAGKTTVLNMISGVIVPSSGRIVYGGASIAAEPMHRLAARGVARTFQNLALFHDLTVLENVLVGLHLSARSSFMATLLRTPSLLREEAALVREASALLRFVGLDNESDRAASALPQGHQRLLEIARALAVHPSLLLLDEPAAGLNGAEVDRLMNLVTKIRDAGITVLLIEHHMQLVMAICEKVTVLDFGRVIADATPADVTRNASVVEAYLGKPAGALVTAEPEDA